MAEQPDPIPSLYLDQNVLSRFVSGSFPGLFNKIRSGGLQLMYSHMHIAETARCSHPEFRSKIVQALEDMNGAYLYEGKLHFDKSPQQYLDEYLANPKEYDDLYNSVLKLGHKFYGGQQGLDFQSVIDDQQESFAELMRHMSEMIETLSEDEQLDIGYILPLLKTFPDLA